jgi:hypothetical protein
MKTGFGRNSLKLSEVSRCQLINKVKSTARLRMRLKSLD